MGYDLFISNPAKSGSHSWQCILGSSGSDSAITKLGYCGRKERFSTDLEVSAVFWKLWHSKKEYLDLPDIHSYPEIDQKFDMVCNAMQGEWETGTTPFDLFDKYEESGEDEPEDRSTYMADSKKPRLSELQAWSLNLMKESKYYGGDQGYSYVEVDNRGFKSYKSRPVQALLNKGLIEIPRNENRGFWGTVESIGVYHVYLTPLAWEYDYKPTTVRFGLKQEGDKLVKEAEQKGAETFASENMVGECGYCASMQGYTPENMLLIADHPDLSHDFCKSCKSHHPDYNPTDECENFKPRNPDVYEGQTWFCQGCGSGTEFLIDANKWVADAETFASETCECGELEEDDGEMYECSCCESAFCVDCIENGDISAFTTYANRPEFLDNPRITETDTGYMGPQGAVCGECMDAIENELQDLPDIHELDDDESANLSAEWYKRVNPLDSSKFYYSYGNRKEYTESDIREGAYGRLGPPDSNESLNQTGYGEDNLTGQTKKLPTKLFNDVKKNFNKNPTPWYDLGVIATIGILTIAAFKRK